MPGQLRTIKRRIRSIESTAKITRAMELVAASKMRRAQLNALAGRAVRREDALRARRPGGDAAADRPRGAAPSPAADRRPQNIGIIFITPDRGLAGGLPSSLDPPDSAVHRRDRQAGARDRHGPQGPGLHAPHRPERHRRVQRHRRQPELWRHEADRAGGDRGLHRRRSRRGLPRLRAVREHRHPAARTSSSSCR